MSIARVSFRTGLALTVAVAPIAAQASRQPALEPQQVAPGVFVFPSENGMENNVDANSTFIVGSRGVLVVDAPSVRLSREHLAWLRRQTHLPVTHLVNTHAHLDHTSGNQVFADSFPGVSILAGEFAKRIGDRRLPSIITANRGAALDSTIDRVRQSVATGRDDNGAILTPYEVGRQRRSLEYLLRERPTRNERRFVSPNTVVDPELRIDLGGRTVFLRNYPGHTLGDIVAVVEDAGVLVAGDLVVHPVPYGTGQSVFRQWSRSLAELERVPGIRTIVPGHGAVLTSWEYVSLEREAIDTLMSQVVAAVRAGLTLEQTRARVNMSRFADIFAGSDPDRRWAFDRYFLGIRRAFDEASGLVN